MILNFIKKSVEDYTKTTFDYCLIHIYRDGHDNIGWHNDKEAMSSDKNEMMDSVIASVSLGEKT